MSLNKLKRLLTSEEDGDLEGPQLAHQELRLVVAGVVGEEAVALAPVGVTVLQDQA